MRQNPHSKVLMARPFASTLAQGHALQRTDRARTRMRVHSAPTVVGLRFAFPHPTLVDVHVVNVAGRRVRTLACGELCAGEHACFWDGFDDAGERCPAGGYVLRLETSGSLLTSRIVSLA